VLGARDTQALQAFYDMITEAKDIVFWSGFGIGWKKSKEKSEPERKPEVKMYKYIHHQQWRFPCTTLMLS